MQATSRLLLGLPVRLLVGGPQMPKNARPAAATLSPSRGSYRGRRDVRVHRPIAPGRSSFVSSSRESFHPSVPILRSLASHPLRRLRSCPSQRGDNAGSIARHTVSKWRSRRARTSTATFSSDTPGSVHPNTIRARTANRDEPRDVPVMNQTLDRKSVV